MNQRPMMNHRYILEPYTSPKSRICCPGCGHKGKTFKRYINTQTNQYLADHVGRCNREDSCGYHYPPRRYFAQNPVTRHIRPLAKRRAVPVKAAFSQLPVSLLRDSMAQKAYIHNNFILFLAGIFGWETALQAAERYNIGTSKHWHGATVFWQVDTKGQVRTGKIMLYDKSTGKRVKQPFNHICWVHALLRKASESPGVRKSESEEEAEPLLREGSESPGVGKSGSVKQVARSAQLTNAKLPDSRLFGLPDFTLNQCLFGEHLLAQDAGAIVAITESEKTAVMASIMMPSFIWLAAGSLHGLDDDKCRVLKNRNVLLFPDVGAYTYWTERARCLNLKIPTATFTVHDEMERTATEAERATGADMGDRWIAEWGCLVAGGSSSGRQQ